MYPRAPDSSPRCSSERSPYAVKIRTPVVGRALEHLLGGLEPVHVRHAQVHDHDVGPAALGQGDGGGAVGRLADHADPRRAGQREAEPLAHDLVVVGDEAGDLVGHGAILRRASAGSSSRQRVGAVAARLVGRGRRPGGCRCCGVCAAYRLEQRSRDAATGGRHGSRRAPRSERPPRASRGRAPRGSARARPA